MLPMQPPPGDGDRARRGQGRGRPITQDHEAGPGLCGRSRLPPGALGAGQGHVQGLAPGQVAVELTDQGLGLLVAHGPQGGHHCAGTGHEEGPGQAHDPLTTQGGVRGAAAGREHHHLAVQVELGDLTGLGQAVVVCAAGEHQGRALGRALVHHGVGSQVQDGPGAQIQAVQGRLGGLGSHQQEAALDASPRHPLPLGPRVRQGLEALGQGALPGRGVLREGLGRQGRGGIGQDEHPLLRDRGVLAQGQPVRARAEVVELLVQGQPLIQGLSPLPALEQPHPQQSRGLGVGIAPQAGLLHGPLRQGQGLLLAHLRLQLGAVGPCRDQLDQGRGGHVVVTRLGDQRHQALTILPGLVVAPGVLVGASEQIEGEHAELAGVVWEDDGLQLLHGGDGGLQVTPLHLVARAHGPHRGARTVGPAQGSTREASGTRASASSSRAKTRSSSPS